MGTGQLKKVSSHLYLKDGVLYVLRPSISGAYGIKKGDTGKSTSLGHIGMAGTLEACDGAITG